MSFKNFIMYLQQILTMVDPKNEYSIALAKTALSSTISLAIASGKVDAPTIRLMRGAEEKFNYLVNHTKDFAGIPGQYLQNEQKRKRLEMFLYPHC